MSSGNSGWFGRVGQSFQGVIGGLVAFLASFPLLFWNEGRAVTMARSLNEGASTVMSVAAEQVDKAHEGKLVHLTGDLQSDDRLEDPVFGLSLPAIKLQRVVEMYQWEEHEHTDKPTQRKTYSFSKRWSRTVINSTGFHDQDMKNPTRKPYDDWQTTAGNVRLGAFRLSPTLLEQFNEFVAVPYTEEAWKQLPVTVRDKVRLDGEGLLVGEDPANPQVGDARLRFFAARPGVVSLIAKQSGNTFEPFFTPVAGAPPLEFLRTGRHTAASMFTEQIQANTTLTWILRGVGFGVMWLGLGLMFRPLVAMASMIPFVADVLELGVGAFTFCIAAILSLLVVALGWISYRPMLGIGLLLLAAGLGYAAYRLGHRAADKRK